MRFLSSLLFVFFLSIGSAGADQEKVISIGGSVTETVYALGASSSLIAVDSTSLFPAEARKLPNVGYMRTLSAEPILSLDPELILLHADSGPASVVNQLEQSGVKIVRLPKATNVAGAVKVIRTIGAAIGKQGAGDILADEVNANAQVIIDRTGAADNKPRVLFMLSIGRGAPLASGFGTAAAGIIEAAGGRNVIDGFQGYKPLSPEAFVTADPEVILVTHRTVKLMGGKDAILDRPEIKPTTAGQTRRLIAIDGLLMLGFGPRVATAVRDLARAFHPDLDLASSN